MPAPTPADIAAGVPAGANIVGRAKAPSGQGELLVDANGGVYDTGGQSFSGSYMGLAPEQRQGSRQFTGITVDPNTGGYTLQSNQPGQNYAFGPSEFVKNMPKANPLYSDPAYLNFLANAGLTYEDAARQVGSKKAALQNALALQTPNIKQQGQDSLDSIYGNYANRGLYGASQQATDEGKAQANTLAQVAQANADTENQINDLESGLATTRRNLFNQTSDKGYGTAGTQDLTNRLNAVDQRYPSVAKTGAI